MIPRAAGLAAMILLVLLSGCHVIPFVAMKVAPVVASTLTIAKDGLDLDVSLKHAIEANTPNKPEQTIAAQ